MIPSSPEDAAAVKVWGLEIARDGEVLVTYRLRGDRPVVLGRGSMVDIQLVGDPSVALRQAFLRKLDEGQFLLEMLDFGRVGRPGAPTLRGPGDCVALLPRESVQVGQQHVLALRRVAKGRTSSLDREDARAPEAVQLRYTGGELALPRDRAVTIGRHPKNDVVLDDIRVSSFHAEVFWHDDGWWVRDIGSTNGTTVRGLAVMEQALEVDSVLCFGGVPVVFEGVLDDGRLRTVTGDSPAVRPMMRDIRRMAMSSAPVTIVGPSGPVRSEIARALHRASPRREGPFLVVACATVVEGLSELFGHVEGAFTGASKDRKGLFEAADGGTLVLEGLEDLAPRHQAALLRTLETSRVRRAGSNAEVSVDVRVVATRGVHGHGRIRDDLRHRLEVLVLQTSSVGR